jgi:LacI family transcriptional regulator
MSPTIKDVAKKAQVSTATVSLVIHNHMRISKPTRKKVLRAIKELNYSPSRIARGLVLRLTHNIGFIVTDDHFLKTEPFYTHVFLGTEFEAREHDYYILLNTIPSRFRDENCLPRFVKENNVDGIIIAGKVPPEIIACLEQYKLPLLFIDYLPPEGNYSAVLIDNINGGMQATSHLISQGHRNIGFIGGDIDHPSIRDRFHGYIKALEKNQIIFNDQLTVLTDASMSREVGYTTAKDLLERDLNITAVFASNDAMALGAMQYFKQTGIRIPNDISIVGFDDVGVVASLDPPLTTISVPIIDLGVKAMQLMSTILKGEHKTELHHIVDVNLVIRESVKKL